MNLGQIGEFFCLHRKFLVYNLVNRNLKIRYRKSFFGMFWTVLIPAVQALVYFGVFTVVLKVKTENYMLLLMSSIVPWTFFATTLIAGLESLVVNQSLLNKVKLPLQALVFAEGLTAFLNLLLSFPVVLIILLLSNVSVGLPSLQYPVLCGLMFIMTYATSLLLGIGFVYFRDLKYVTTLALQLWFYLTPITYDSAMIPEQYRFVLKYNPVGFLFEGFHIALVRQEWLPLEYWGSIFGWTLLALVLAIWTWAKARSQVIEVL